MAVAPQGNVKIGDLSRKTGYSAKCWIIKPKGPHGETDDSKHHFGRILGKKHLNVPLKDNKELTLTVNTDCCSQSKNTLILADAYFITQQSGSTTRPQENGQLALVSTKFPSGIQLVNSARSGIIILFLPILVMSLTHVFFPLCYPDNYPLSYADNVHVLKCHHSSHSFINFISLLIYSLAR